MLAGGGGSDATTYAGNELKYNYLYTNSGDRFKNELKALFLTISSCPDDEFEKCDPNLKASILKYLIVLSKKPTKNMSRT